MLASSDVALSDAYDLAVLDLDGVVYVGSAAVPGAPDHLASARSAGMSLAFVTNNAARPPRAVTEHLRSLGIECDDGDVVTSAQAAARLLADELDEGAAVYVIGGDGLLEALRERGLRPVTSADDHPVAVVQGYGPDMAWSRVVTGAILVRQGLPWVASNTDATIPTPLGVGPGNGALVDLVSRFAEREPTVAGKPESPLFRETLLRVGGHKPLMIGDRLDTDILGARTMGWDSMVVLTGVTDLASLIAAPADQRPSYVAADLAGLTEPHPAPAVDDDAVVLGGWRATSGQGRLEITGDGEAADWWRVAAVAGWRHLDATGQALEVGDVRVPGSGED